MVFLNIALDLEVVWFVCLDARSFCYVCGIRKLGLFAHLLLIEGRGVGVLG